MTGSCENQCYQKFQSLHYQIMLGKRIVGNEGVIRIGETWEKEWEKYKDVQQWNSTNFDSKVINIEMIG